MGCVEFCLFFSRHSEGGCTISTLSCSKWGFRLRSYRHLKNSLIWRKTAKIPNSTFCERQMFFALCFTHSKLSAEQCEILAINNIPHLPHGQFGPDLSWWYGTAILELTVWILPLGSSVPKLCKIPICSKQIHETLRTRHLSVRWLNFLACRLPVLLRPSCEFRSELNYIVQTQVS